MSRNRSESGNKPRNEWRPRDETDPYVILGVEEDATSEEIKSAYRARAMKYHPDVNPDGEEDFKKISHAFDLLRDAAKRAAYDDAGIDKEEYYEHDFAVWKGYVIPSEPAGSNFNPNAVFVAEGATETFCPFCGSKVFVGHAKGLFDCGRGHVLNVEREKGRPSKRIEQK